MFTFKELNRIISAFRPAVIYCMEEPFTLFARECVRYAQEFHCPLAIFTWENRLDFRLNDPLDRIEQEVIRSADKIICGNRLAKRRMISCGANPDKLHVLLQSGIDTELFRPIEEINKTYDIVYHGRLVREKGLYFLENACRDLKKTLLTVGGRGQYHVKYGDSHDWTDYKELPSLINTAKIGVQVPYAFNGYQEQGNFSAGECMASGLPVIVSRNGSVPDNYNGAPISMIDECDEQGLKEQIVDLLSDEEKLKRKGIEGREWIINNLSVNVIAKRLLEVLELV